ncbi:MAG TPA: bifunctional NUDIX hydrolase/histidine phosphatase family protein [Micromonosporaceae bacterium]|nr:bifunctional NUDIX hydrolase/histidine phosphatase family protein [Micromonosporaceae bacterium]
MADVRSRVVLAAGGVVWRPVGDAATLEVALVHRPRYDDWTLPKGKLEKGEHPLTAAVREVLEETGVSVVPQLRLPRIRYLTGEPGVEKVVDFWSMRATAVADRAPDDEVDEVRWVAIDAATDLLTYGHDRGVVRALLQRPRVSGLVALIRHARAGERGKWDGPDAARPLDDHGEEQARALDPVLGLLAPTRIVSASALRCRQTVRPLADRLGLTIETDPRFDESAAPAAATTALRALADAGDPVVVCSQGKLIPPLLESLTGRRRQHFRTGKGAGWILSFGDGDVASADFLDPDPEPTSASAEL